MKAEQIQHKASEGIQRHIVWGCQADYMPMASGTFWFSKSMPISLPN
jgi:hypothetical protein